MVGWNFTHDNSGWTTGGRAAIAAKRWNYRFSITTGMAALAVFRWSLFLLLGRRDTELLGAYAIAVAIATPIVVFFRLRLRSVQASQTDSSFQFGHYSALTLLGGCCGLAIVASIALAGRQDNQMIGVILLVTLRLLIESGCELCYGQFMNAQRIELIGRSMILRAIVSGVVAASALESGASLMLSLVVLALFELMLWIAHDVRHLRQMLADSDEGSERIRGSILPTWDDAALLRLAIMALPLAFGTALASLNVNIPRYFLEASAGLHELGIFSAIATLTVPGNLLTLGATQAALASVSRSLARGDKDEARSMAVQLIAYSLIVGIGFVVLYVIAGDWLLVNLFGQEYAGNSTVIRLLAIAAAVTYVGYVLGMVTVAAHRFRSIAFVYVLSLVVVLVASASIVGRYGIVGAAVVQLLNSLCTTTLLGVNLKLIFGSQHDS